MLPYLTKVAANASCNAAIKSTVDNVTTATVVKITAIVFFSLSSSSVRLFISYTNMLAEYYLKTSVIANQRPLKNLITRSTTASVVKVIFPQKHDNWNRKTIGTRRLLRISNSQQNFQKS